MSRPLLRTIARWLILSLNALVVAGLLASYLAGTVNPATFWPLAFAGLAYPLLLLLTLGFTLYWSFNLKWKLLVFHIVLIAVRFDLVAAHFQFGNDTEADNGQGIRVMSYNVHMFGAYDMKDNTGPLSTMFGNIMGQQSDIVCIQEYFSYGRRNSGAVQQEFDDFLSGRNAHLESYQGTGEKPYTSGTALTTVSAHAVTGRGTLVSPNNRNMRCIYTDMLVGSDTIRVYNAHLESIRIKDEDFEAMNQALRLDEQPDYSHLRTIIRKVRDAFINRAGLANAIAEHIASCPYPVIICGDFNDTPASYSYQRIAKGMKDSFREAGSGFGVTYERIPLFRIDNILFSPHFRASAHEVHRWPHSDHFAVTATLHLE